jgi:hypothetical protein
VPAGTYILSTDNGSAFNTTSPDDLVVGSLTNFNTTIIGMTAAGTPLDPSQVIIEPSAAAKAAATPTGAADIIEGALNPNTGAADLPLNLTLQNLTLTGGTASAVFVGAENATATAHSVTNLTNCIFSNNTDPFQGGAVSNFGAGDLNVTDCTFVNNSATDSTLGQGGAIFFQITNAAGQDSHGSLSVTGSTFIGNTAAVTTANDGAGGAIYLQGVTPTTGSNTYSITTSTFLANSATGASTLGGAVANVGATGTLTVSFSRFAGNSAPGGGAALANTSQGTVTASNDWWGTNAGPGAFVANTGTPPGTLNDTDWLELEASASPTTVEVNHTSSVTSDLFKLKSGDGYRRQPGRSGVGGRDVRRHPRNDHRRADLPVRGRHQQRLRDRQYRDGDDHGAARVCTKPGGRHQRPEPERFGRHLHHPGRSRPQHLHLRGPQFDERHRHGHRRLCDGTAPTPCRRGHLQHRRIDSRGRDVGDGHDHAGARFSVGAGGHHRGRPRRRL